MIVAMTWTRAAQIAGRGARLGLVAVVLLGLWRGAATPVILAAFFLAISLLVERIAPPVLDACFGVVLLAHASGVLLGGPADSGVWGPAMHLAAPFLVALILAVAAADGRLLAPAASLRVALGTASSAASSSSSPGRSSSSPSTGSPESTSTPSEGTR